MSLPGKCPLQLIVPDYRAWVEKSRPEAHVRGLGHWMSRSITTLGSFGGEDEDNRFIRGISDNGDTVSKCSPVRQPVPLASNIFVPSQGTHTPNCPPSPQHDAAAASTDAPLATTFSVALPNVSLPLDTSQKEQELT